MSAAPAPVWALDRTQHPYADEHEVTIAADVEEVWLVVLASVDEGFGEWIFRVLARALRSEHPRASGPRPLAVGSTVTGSQVVTCEPRRRLVLEGRNRFSRDRFEFELMAEGENRTRLSAHTWAVFPGRGGRVYRVLVIRGLFHTLSMRGLLRTCKWAAERSLGREL